MLPAYITSALTFDFLESKIIFRTYKGGIYYSLT
jgi:hypothetical protein